MSSGPAWARRMAGAGVTAKHLLYCLPIDALGDARNGVATVLSLVLVKLLEPPLRNGDVTERHGGHNERDFRA